MVSTVSLPGLGGPGWLILAHGPDRWDEGVWPERVLRRLATLGRVVYVEPPEFADGSARAALEVTLPAPGVERVVPKFPATLRDQASEAWLTLRRLLHSELGVGRKSRTGRDVFVHWFASADPASAMLNGFGESLVVYDALAESRAAADSATENGRSLLLARADLVFVPADPSPPLPATRAEVVPIAVPAKASNGASTEDDAWSALADRVRDVIARGVPKVKATSLPPASGPRQPTRRTPVRRRLVRPDR